MRLTISLLGCLIVQHVTAFTITLTPHHETCGNSNGAIDVYIEGPIMEPVSYDWSNGSTTPNLTGIQAGTYSVTIVDFLGGSSMAQVDVLNLPGLSDIGGGQWTYGVEELTGFQGPACPGECNGSRFMYFQDGTGPYSVEWNDPGISQLGSYIGYPAFTGFCNGGAYAYTVTDALGCPGTGMFTDDLIDGANPPFITSIEGACGGGANGAVEANVNFDWYGQNVTSLWQNGSDITNSVAYEYLGDWVLRYSNLAPGDYEYRQMAGSPGLPSTCYEIIPFTIEDLGNACGNVSGTLYLDHDQDCVQDTTDPGVAYRVLDIQPGNELAITNADGSYSRNLPLGAYDLAPTGSDLYPLCPATAPALFDLTVGAPLATLNLADSSLIDLDLQALIIAGAARPGFIHSIHGQVRNLSGQQSAPLDVVFTFDPQLTFASAEPAPTTVAGNTVTWSGVDVLDGYGILDVSIALQVPANPDLIGAAIEHTLTVTQAFAETSTTNNTAVWSDVITGSFDPNEKHARTSSGLSEAIYFIVQDEWIDYTIRFQNTGTDTAFTVLITDTLSDALDMSSFEQGPGSHPFTVRFKPGRVVEWRLEHIRLPDSGTNELESHGLIGFRVRPDASLAPGTLIENTANIYFDFNPPVITEPSVLVAEFSTGIEEVAQGQLRLQPNPVEDRINVLSDKSIDAIVVLAADGREVMRRAVRAATAAIDVSALKAGAYVLVAWTIDGTLAHARFIKH